MSPLAKQKKSGRSQRPIVTLLTDFGEHSGYVAQMKAAILEINRDVVLVDISHSVGAQDIASAAWLLRDVAAAFPPDAIHVAVVDPGVGTSRRIIGVNTARGVYIAPDNGVLTLVIDDFVPAALIELDDSAYWRSTISATFHGRDIMGPVAGHLARGIPLAEMGSSLTDIQRLALPRAVVTEYEIDGVIIRIDTFGNLITNITALDLAEVSSGPELNWECRGHHTQAMVETYAAARPGDLVALMGSSARLELAIVNGNASQELKASVGDAVRGRRVHIF
jgi:S-adenosylmethionine hydrolase